MSYEAFSHVGEGKEQLPYREGSEHASEADTIEALEANRNRDKKSIK